ncbi:MAG: response regulator transcription factor [Vampirovibrionales bacterium]|nr:response regulator transcription factor [Vampirovibrionales bacterium]
MPDAKRPIRIVFTDDYELIRMGVSAYLDALPDMDVLAQAGTANDGIEAIRRHEPDIALMDVTLPDMSGIEATRLLKAEMPQLKVIMLTSHESQETVMAALGAGANAYCLKGIPTERLVEVIRSVMDGAAWLDPAIATVALSVFSEKAPRSGETLDAASVKPAEEGASPSLGAREREVLRLLTEGKNNQEIANQLFVSVHTVKFQVSAILQKLAVHDRVQAAVKAITTGLIRPEELHSL